MNTDKQPEPTLLGNEHRPLTPGELVNMMNKANKVRKTNKTPSKKKRKHVKHGR
jgi:hypothetical protein